MTMTSGTAIGSGILIDGRIHAGANNGAGEIGLWRIGPPLASGAYAGAIGAAANVAARHSDLGKSLEVPMLFSHDIATKVGRPLQSLGKHRLHNIVSPVEVFTL